MTERTKLCIIADDLTGACDSAVAFASERGVPVVIAESEGAAIEAARMLDSDACLAVDTESRHVDPSLASQRVATVVRALASSSHGRAMPLVFKKVDSTLRGNVAAELDAVSTSLPGRVIVLAPAFPAAGRTTEHGECLVRGVSLASTEFAADPLDPVRESSVAAYAPGTARVTLTDPDGLADALTTARASAEALLSVGASATREPARVIVADARTDDDLRTIARACLQFRDRIVCAGSGGLAAALAELLLAETTDRVAAAVDGPIPAGHMMPPPPAVSESPVAAAAPAREARAPAIADASVSRGSTRGGPRTLPRGVGILVVVGSRSPRSRAQAACFAREEGAATVLPDEPRSLRRLVQALRDGGAAVLTTSTAAADPGRTAARLADVAARAIEESGARVVATGGDTVRALLAALGETSLRVVGEIESGVPLVLVGGARMPIVTKAGGFGGDDVFVRAAQRLRRWG